MGQEGLVCVELALSRATPCDTGSIGRMDNEPLLPAAAAAAAAAAAVNFDTRDTFWPCVANLSKVIIGAGMMAIPQAYCRIGSLAGTSMLVLVGLMTYTTLVFLLRGSQATGATTYSQLTRVMCGGPVMKVLQLAILSFCFGFGVVYLVIIRDILLGTPPDCNGLLCEVLGLLPSSIFYDARVVILLVALLVCCPLLLLRTMDRLAVLNVVGVGAIGMLAVTALGLAAKSWVEGSAYPIPVWPQWQQLGHTRAEQLQALMGVMPVMIACYVAHQSLHPLMPLLQPYSDARMRGVIASALLIAFGVFGSLAVGSSLAFGPMLEVNVLNNFSVTGLQPLAGPLLARLLSWVIRGGYLLSLLASLLLYMHPLRACLAEMVWPDTCEQTPGSEAGGSSGHPSSEPYNGTFGQQQLAGNGLPDHGSEKHAQEGAYQRTSQPGLPTGALPRGGVSRLQGSAFATPAAQAAAAAVDAHSRASTSGGGALLSTSNSRQLTPFDSFDNPRSGSWSGVRYLSNVQTGPQPAAVQQPSKAGARPSLTPAPQGSRQQQHTGHAGHQATSQGSVHVIVTDARDAASAHAAASQEAAGQQRWQQAEQQWYYLLTYGLLAAMVLVAIAVPNIWTALSAIGDLASTLQAFVVPGLIGLLLSLRGTRGAGPAKNRLQHIGSGSVGVVAVLLGMALFVNGIYQRV